MTKIIKNNQNLNDCILKIFFMYKHEFSLLINQIKVFNIFKENKLTLRSKLFHRQSKIYFCKKKKKKVLQILRIEIVITKKIIEVNSLK